MADHARSSDPAVQRQLDRFAQLSPGRDILGLERITALLAHLGNPQERLPPVFHVAGTNGKGSTCAFLRAILESAGQTVHVLHEPASRPLQRTHPDCGQADRRRRARPAPCRSPRRCRSARK